MRATVISGASSAASRSAGAPPGVAIPATAGASKTTDAHPGGEPEILRRADPEAGNVGDEVFHARRFHS